jgi:hypothetical protein
VRACCTSRSWSSAALEEKAKLRRRVCRLQHPRWRDGLGGSRFLCVGRCCGGSSHGHCGSGGLGNRAGLQNHGVLLVSQPAASASAARPIHCDRSALVGKRAEPLERRSSDDDPRGVRATAARRRCGVCIERVAVGRMAGLSVQWSCRRGEHGASQARDERCSFCAKGGKAMRREVDHEAMCRCEHDACGAQHRDTTRSTCGGVRVTALRTQTRKGLRGHAAARYPRGMAASSRCVYASRGAARICAALACSTTTPSFITSTSSLMKRTTARSWLMKT